MQQNSYNFKWCVQCGIVTKHIFCEGIYFCSLCGLEYIEEDEEDNESLDLDKRYSVKYNFRKF